MDCLSLITARTKIVTALGAFALLAGCAAHAGFPAYSTVPDFTLTDQSGAAFNSSAQLKNNVWIADFIYTRCPGPCPRMSSQMHSIEDALSGVDGVRLVSFTVDPERDTPKVLADYAERFSAKRGVWFFLTGPPDSLQHLSRDVFMLGNVDGNLEHSTRFVLIDRASKIRGYYQSDEPGVTVRLVADTKRLLREPN